MSCSQCFTAQVPECDDIAVLGFPPNYPLYYLIQKAGKPIIHSRLTSTDNQGKLIIGQDSLPAGYLVAGSSYTVELRNGSNYLQKILFHLGENDYECLQLDLVRMDAGEGVTDANMIDGGAANLPDGPGQNYLIPIDSSEFLDGDKYLNPALAGKDLAIFWDDVPRYLTADEWEHTTAMDPDTSEEVPAIRILADGFTAATQHLHIYIIGNLL